MTKHWAVIPDDGPAIPIHRDSPAIERTAFLRFKQPHVPGIRVLGTLDFGHLAVPFPLFVMENESKIAADAAKKKPVKTLWGDDVCANIFSQGSRGGTFHIASFSRSYKGPDGAWKYARSFAIDDLGKLQSLIEQVREFVNLLSQQTVK
jgi:hypothetical protein